MLQVNMNRHNYKFYVDTYVQRSLSLIYAFISLARIDLTLLSYLQTCLQHSLSWMYVFKD